jgi:hypothetical protein
MKHNFLRYIAVVLLIGVGALPPGRAYALQQDRRIELLSFPYGVASGQTVRTSMFNPSFVGGVFVAARIQLLDMEGEVIAQSDEIRIGPGKIRFWDVSRDQLRAEGDPGTGRLQVRTRILVTTTPLDANCNQQPLAPTVELINPSTGETASFRFMMIDGQLIVVPPPNS